jgi:class 3 adenylate cyclase
VLDAGQDAVRHRRWIEGFELLSAADVEELLDPPALEALADAAYAVGRYDEALHARERAHKAYLESGDRGLAAAAAIKVANVFVRRGEFPLVGGWMATAERLLEQQPESVGHGLLTWVQGMFAYVVHRDLAAADRLADETMEIGRRLGDPEVHTLGLAIRGEVRARQGDMEAPRLIDEAMATALSGALSPWATCHILCRTMILCQETGDFRRARQWTAAARETCTREGVTPISGDCRVHHAGLLNWQGEWGEAELEAETGCREVPDDLLHVGMASYEIGEIRLYRGDLTGAEEAFRRAHEHGRSPHPGLALVRLAQGNAQAALAMINTALEDETLPPGRAVLLAAQVELALAAGDPALARTGVEELAAIELAAPAPASHALALAARGAVAFADGDHPTARMTLRNAVKRWTELGVPYRAARARLLLADTYLACGDPNSAEVELTAAQSTFERLGAQPDAYRASQALRRLSVDVATAQPDTRVRRAFMFTDIVGSTSLLEALGDDAWADLLRWHDNALRAQFAAHHGQEVHYTGDGFFAAFTSAADALRCAECIQRKLATHRRVSGFAPQVRIGVHVDEATMDSSNDYHGRGVHVAARVGAEAGAGEVLVSRQALDAAGPDFVPAGSRVVALKGLTRQLELLSLRWD